MWTQVYEPHGWPWWAAAIVAALPIGALFYLLGIRKSSAPLSAAAGAIVAILVAWMFIGMPADMAIASFGLGAATGLLPIGWVVFAAMFLFQIAVDTGKFEIMKASIARLTPDRRLQVLIIAFSFGAIIEGAAGFGTPVAISAALLVGLGFKPFPAAVLCLIANTAPVAWGSVGTPIRMLADVSGLPINDLSAMNARILPITSVIVPIWLVRSMVSWKETVEVLPACLVCGISFAVTQFVWGNFIEVGLVDIIAGGVSIFSCAVFFKFWKPKKIWRYPDEAESSAPELKTYSAGQVFGAWLPFLVLFVFVVLWGVMRAKTDIDTVEWGPFKTTYSIPVPGLDKQMVRAYPVVPKEPAPKPEGAVYKLTWYSATGTGVLMACIVTSILLRQRPIALGMSFLATCRRMKIPILAIVPMLGLAAVTRYSGIDAILGLAFTRTGVLYPFFGTLLGWLGVALTGSDTASNALFGSLQRITAESLKIDPVLMCSANSAGGVMGKMVDAQSIVVAATAANIVGQEGNILLAVLWHSIALASIVGAIVLAYAYLFPGAVPHGVVFF